MTSQEQQRGHVQPSTLAGRSWHSVRAYFSNPSIAALFSVLGVAAGALGLSNLIFAAQAVTGVLVMAVLVIGGIAVRSAKSELRQERLDLRRWASLERWMSEKLIRGVLLRQECIHVGLDRRTTPGQVRELVGKARDFQQQVEKWMKEHPDIHHDYEAAPDKETPNQQLIQQTNAAMGFSGSLGRVCSKLAYAIDKKKS